jgi:hypothetical protein
MDLVLTIRQEELVIESIKALGLKVCPADISKQTGLSLNAVVFILNRLASESSARLTVSPTGELLYIFKKGFEHSKSNKDWRQNLILFFRRLYGPAFFCFKAFFGMALAFSLGTWGLVMLVFGDRNPQPSFWDNIRALVKDPSARPSEEAKSLFDCYNFIFGPSNPNSNIDEKKWQCIAKLIEQHEGAIIAEQLSPYTGISAKDDYAILSTLVRFNGRPAVTDSGNLVYIFPSMSTTALERAPLNQPLEPFLKETKLELFGISPQRIFFIGCYVAINGVWGYCLYLLTPLLFVLGLPPLAILAGVLAAFSLIITLYVLLRLPLDIAKNIFLFWRNSKRENYAQELRHPKGQLEIRLREAKELSVKSNFLSETNIIFDSDRGALEQIIDNL